ncbi:lipopolysaccharide biosynthesis protein [Aeromicrobium sp.]|uniref:lipopolysaccharide biosynthesis protein n=1 Tax=Aeromicrobium sp. TaxID=1871063 RepID=UPI003D6BA273
MSTVKPTFRANFSRVARANLIALALPVLAAPILSRLFLPSDFASLAVFVAIAAVIGAFATWRFDWVVPNEPDAVRAKTLFVLGGCVLVFSTLVVLVVLCVAQVAVGLETWSAQLGLLLLLLPLLVLAGGLRDLFSGWFVRRGDLTAVSRATVSRSVANVLLSIGSGAARMGATGLIGAAVLSAWAGSYTLARHSGVKLRDALGGVSRLSLRSVLRAHGRTATWSTAVSILNALSLNAPVLVLAVFFSPVQVGWYALINRTAAAPISAVTAALAQSFWSLAADHARRHEYEEIAQAYQRVTRRLAVAALVVVGLCLTGPIVVGPILGSEWAGAGFVLMAMAPMLVGNVMFSPTNHLVVFDKQHLQLAVDLLRLLLVIGAISSAYYLDLGFYVAVFLASTGSLAAHTLLFFLHVKVHGSNVSR